MRLDLYTVGGFERGVGRLTEVFWFFLSAALFESWLPGSSWRVCLLRLFGARIGYNCVIKPGVKIKFPWRLTIGSHCWVGERVWIDNLAQVTLGNHVCLSQDAYLCTGSHDWSSETFNLVTRSITIESHSWVCARASLAPGVVLGEGAVLGMGLVAVGHQEAWTIRSHKGVAPRRPTINI